MSYIGTEPKDIRSFGRTKFDYTATQGQTAFTGADDDGKVLAFTVGQIEVYVNGILMDDSDFTTTGTGTVTLASAANLNDVINIVSFESNIPDNDYVPASGGTFSGNVTHSGTVTNSGNVTVGGTLGVTGASTMNGDVAINGTLTTTSTGTTLSSNSYNVVKIQTDKDDNGSNDDGILQFTTGSSNTVKGELRYDESESMFEIGHGDNQGHIRIDSSGRVTMPSQPSFSYTSNSAWSISTTTQEKFTSSNVFSAGVPSVFYHNTGNHFNASTGTFTAPIAGRYKFHANTTMYNFSSGYFYIYIYVNNNQSVYKQFSQQSGVMAQGVLDVIINLFRSYQN